MGIFQTEDRADRAASHYGAEGDLAATITTLRRERDEALAELALLRGGGQTPQRGCFHVTSFIDDAEVLVEIEHEAETGDGWNEPHYDATCTPIQVLINGSWVDACHFSEELAARWTDAAWEHLKGEREYASECRAEALAEAAAMRREELGVRL